jgi:hypothetical protein
MRNESGSVIWEMLAVQALGRSDYDFALEMLLEVSVCVCFDF